MRCFAPLGLLALTSCAGPGGVPASQFFAGELRLAGNVLPLDVIVDSTGTRISNRTWRLEQTPATVTTSGDTAIALVATDQDSIRFAGVRKDGRWSGVATRGAAQAEFELVALTPTVAALEQQVVGTYRTGDGRLVGIGLLTEFGNRPMLTDYTSGRLAPLIAIGPTRFLVGQAIVAPLFPAETLDVRRGSGGTIDGIEYRLTGGETISATRVPATDQELTFDNGTVRLAGTWTTPAGPGPFPALVLVHGSNAQSRDAFGPWVRFFVGHGFAVLAYDKRGTGRSTGDWKQADFHLLAEDAKAAVRAVAARPDVMRSRIGMWGISQAGWILPLVAAAMPDTVAFVVVHAGSGTTVREQGVLNFRNELRFAGLPEEAVALGVRYRRLDDSVTLGLVPLERQTAFFKEHQPRAEWLDEPAPLDAWFRGYYRMLMNFDPTEAWSKVKVPVLLFFGERDANVPPAESWPPIDRALAAAGNQAVTHFILPGANHVFLEAPTGAAGEYPRLRRFVPGYFDRMATWLESRVR